MKSFHSTISSSSVKGNENKIRWLWVFPGAGVLVEWSGVEDDIMDDDDDLGFGENVHASLLQSHSFSFGSDSGARSGCHWNIAI